VCGDDPSAIWRLPIDDLTAEPTEIAELPADLELGMNASVAGNAATGHVDLYLELYDCHTEDPDIYVLRAVDAEPTT
jgi:hypothetical protein